MLVLSRKVGEQIIVGNAVFTIVKINGNRVSVGVSADESIPIVRGELVQRDAAVATELNDTK